MSATRVSLTTREGACGPRECSRLFLLLGSARALACSGPRLETRIPAFANLNDAPLLTLNDSITPHGGEFQVCLGLISPLDRRSKSLSSFSSRAQCLK